MQTFTLAPNSETIAKCTELLKSNKLVAFPTESVYGLGANALNSQAVELIYKAKGRPSDNPLIIHISSTHMLESITHIPSIYMPLISKFWPGPLTILLPKPDEIPAIVTGGTDKLAVRMPNHPFALQLIESCGFPLAAPSANTSGRPSPTTASHVFADLNGKIEMIVDGGACEVGVESTVIDALSTPPVILRPGGITLEMVCQIPGFHDTRLYRGQEMAAPATPGMKYRHYTPDALVAVVKAGAGMHERVLQVVDKFHGKRIGLLSIQDKLKYPSHVQVVHMGTEFEEIGRNLFAGMRELEFRGVDCIIIEGVEECRQGAAIMNRILKAASYVC